MSESTLSPDARRRLWQCYSILLILAEEAENNMADTEIEGVQTSTVAATPDAIDERASYPIEEEDAGDQSEPEAREM